MGKLQKNINFKTQQINTYTQKTAKINFLTNNNQNKMILPKFNEFCFNNNFNDVINQKITAKKDNNSNFIGQKRKITPSFVTTVTNND